MAGVGRTLAMCTPFKMLHERILWIWVTINLYVWTLKAYGGESLWYVYGN